MLAPTMAKKTLSPLGLMLKRKLEKALGKIAASYRRGPKFLSGGLPSLGKRR
jgi:hypothetical protein